MGSLSPPVSSHGSFDQSSFSGAHLMKLFPPGSGCSMTSSSTMTPASGSSPSPPNLFRSPGTPASLPHAVGQSYAAEFSSYGPMYSSYYAKQAQVMGANNTGSRSSPYHRNMYTAAHAGHTSPAATAASCYQNSFQGAAGALYPRYDYNTPR